MAYLCERTSAQHALEGAVFVRLLEVLVHDGMLLAGVVSLTGLTLTRLVTMPVNRLHVVSQT